MDWVMLASSKRMHINILLYNIDQRCTMVVWRMTKAANIRGY